MSLLVAFDAIIELDEGWQSLNYRRTNVGILCEILFRKKD